MRRVVIVTGANSGLGKGFATALAHADFTVVGTVRQEKAVAEIEAIRPGDSFARVLDVTDEPAPLPPSSKRSSAASALCMRSSTMPDTDTKEHWKKAPWMRFASSSR